MILLWSIWTAIGLVKPQQLPVSLWPIDSGNKLLCESKACHIMADLTIHTH